ncbi:MAG: c-type cytochrome [Candidatus Thioglobus sp.]|jgi:cytochrome c553
MRWSNILLSIACSFTMTISVADDHRNVELLVSSCAACHGTQGHSVGGTPRLAGLDSLHFIEQMRQFTSEERPSTVMHHHATGYTEEEIKLMAEFFSKQ